MADTAAWLVDRVLPDVGVRQWVPTFPWSLRLQLARDPAPCRAVRRTFLRAVFGDDRRRAGLEAARTGAFNFPLAPPTDKDVAKLCRTIRDRVLRLLARRGSLESAAGSGADQEPPLLDALAAASIAGRVALGERAGRTLTRIGARPGREVSFVPGPRPPRRSTDGSGSSANRRHPWAELTDRAHSLSTCCAAPTVVDAA